jgi:hypothetical protein
MIPRVLWHARLAYHVAKLPDVATTALTPGEEFGGAEGGGGVWQ